MVVVVVKAVEFAVGSSFVAVNRLLHTRSRWEPHHHRTIRFDTDPSVGGKEKHRACGVHYGAILLCFFPPAAVVHRHEPPRRLRVVPAAYRFAACVCMAYVDGIIRGARSGLEKRRWGHRSLAASFHFVNQCEIRYLLRVRVCVCVLSSALS